MSENHDGITARRGGHGTAAAIQEWLVGALARELGLDPEQIDVRSPFAALGIESIHALALAADLSDLLGRELPPTLLWDYPTVEALARHLSETPS